MSGMISHVLASLALAFLQDDDPAAAAAARAREEALRAQQERQAVREQQEMREKSQQSLRDFLAPTPDIKSQVMAQREKEFTRKYQKLPDAFFNMETALEELSDAVTTNTNAKRPAKYIQESAKIFLDFLRYVDKRSYVYAEPDFKKYTQEQLRQETLSLLRDAIPTMNNIMESTNREVTVDIAFLEAIPQMQLQLLHLQRTAKRLK
jgi:hypothetical protein